MFPFSAILGQDPMRRALILCAVNHRAGGLLIAGAKGTAKSSAVRAFGETLHREIITLPLNVTSDRLVGSIDIEKTISAGRPVFQPGLLSRAHGGILYVDEVNLLSDHITDILLEAAANKVNRVEREGISYFHECDFILIGTMNFEEGPLRPQFLDRFGLFVYTQSVQDPDIRAEIVRNRDEYEANPGAFQAKHAAGEQAIRDRIAQARLRLGSVVVQTEELRQIADRCLEANVDGHRGDLVMHETLRAIAAFDGKTAISDSDIEESAFFALPHRTKQESPPPPENEREEQNQNEPQHNEQDQREPEQNDEPAEPQGARGERREGQDTEDAGKDEGDGQEGDKPQHSRPQKGKTQVFAIGKDFRPQAIAHRGDRKSRVGDGKRTSIRSALPTGHYIYSVMDRKNGDIAFDATIRAAAPFQQIRKDLIRTYSITGDSINADGKVRAEPDNRAILIEPQDIREKIRQTRMANLLVFVVDSSGSMGAQQRMMETKGAVLSLLKDAYIKRDKIAMIVFRGDKASLVLPPTASSQRAYKLLQDMETGGKTPLNDGIRRGYEVIQNETRKSKHILPMLILITDGRGNVPIRAGAKVKSELMELGAAIGKKRNINSIVIDIEKPNMLTFGLARDLAVSLGAAYFKVDALKQETIVDIVRR